MQALLTPNFAQRGRHRGRGRGQGSGRGWTFRLDHSDSDNDLTGSCDTLSNGGRSLPRGVQQRTEGQNTQECVLSDVESSTSSESSGTYCCPICGLPTRVLWVACDSCDHWYHAECTDINPDDFCNLHNVDWVRNDSV